MVIAHGGSSVKTMLGRMSKENRIRHSRRSDKNQFQEIEDLSDRERMTKERMSPNGEESSQAQS
jgi:hypothetical protein